jgi:hypothetical protein
MVHQVARWRAAHSTAGTVTKTVRAASAAPHSVDGSNTMYSRNPCMHQQGWGAALDGL